LEHSSLKYFALTENKKKKKKKRELVGKRLTLHRTKNNNENTIEGHFQFSNKSSKNEYFSLILESFGFYILLY
jgi:hypothetical protein